ncbi:MAG: hypothetical protein JJ879_07655 [Sneathiella sp.]|nr:hypothetical protein [Sneathiella sp.]
MFDLESLEAGVPLTPLSSIILARPLQTRHVSVLKQYFANLSQSSHWCGYAFLENIPESLKRTLAFDGSSKNLGLVLFSENTDQVRFIYRDTYENFHLINADGDAVFMSDQLEQLLHRFVDRPVC